jgi:hypothetical protein
MMKKITLLAATIGLSMATSAQAQSSFSGMGVKTQNVEVADHAVSQKLLTLEYGRQASDYVDVRVWAGFAITDAETSVQTDTYILDHTATEVITDEYRSTLEVTGEYGIDATFSLPIKESWWAYASAGYQVTQWEGEYYSAFDDTPPSADPAADFEGGSSKCAVTGQEAACGTAIEKSDGKGSFKGAVGEIGLRWSVSPSTQLTVGYRRTLGAEEVSHGATAALRFVW